MLPSAFARAATRSGAAARTAARRYTTETATPKKKSSIGKKLLWTTALSGAVYGGATYAALVNEAFYDTYVTYVPGGEKVLDAIEDAMHDPAFKSKYEKALELKQQAQKGTSRIREFGVSAKETTNDWYEYASEAYAQLTGKSDGPQQPGSGRPASRKTRDRIGLFKDVPIVDQDAVVPQFEITHEAALDELAATVQELVKMLNESGLKGHAKRLADVAGRDIQLLQAGFKRVRAEQTNVSTHVSELGLAAVETDEHVRQYVKEIEDKIQSVRERSRAKVQEKVSELQAEQKQEAHELERHLTTITQQELSAQREAVLQALSQELQERAVEIQRQYVRDVRRQVEEERGGRLARVGEVATRQRFLEQASYKNAEQLDDSRKAHMITLAVDALARAAYAGNKQAFMEELQALLTISAPSSPFADLTERRNDEMVQLVASQISESVALHGISSVAELAERFTTVAAEVRHASLIPEEGSSMVSHLVSIVLSKLMFKKEGLVPGDDVEARLARAEYYLEKEHDLESAAREMNQLKGWPKHLSMDWLDAARRHLEVKQALEVMRSQALLGSMLQLNLE
ncbi:mitochondrial inner membrane protein-domain-containing protein [Syncephalastrum racemosum]|uniref:MICOS complex subunit MIC60 n=1 Tax=Syncephalastrum racemosum TaxID=13706 RepID=A0A1X2H4C0_SYNRA|nr:mitochondrial inner membrane protein-domain-containing protein [Syncephalastrum racemosum]